MEIELIRHFATEGNLEKRYIGVTDEEIKAEFVLEHTLKKEENGREEWKPELVIVSPLRRCRQTAEILFPGEPVHIIEELAEHFNYEENYESRITAYITQLQKDGFVKLVIEN